MKKLIIILIMFIGCASSPKPVGVVVLKKADKVVEPVKKEVAKYVNPSSDASQNAQGALRRAEKALLVSEYGIPFKHKFNAEIRAKSAQADNSMAEARKAFKAGNYNRTIDMAGEAEILAKESKELSDKLVGVNEKEKKLMAEYKIKEARKNNKNTFEAENYMEQKNYDKALDAVADSNKIVIASNKIIIKNDCLWNLAKAKYGNGSKWILIYKANKDKISNPNLIFPGQVLYIPVLK